MCSQFKMYEISGIISKCYSPSKDLASSLDCHQCFHLDSVSRPPHIPFLWSNFDALKQHPNETGNASHYRSELLCDPGNGGDGLLIIGTHFFSLCFSVGINTEDKGLPSHHFFHLSALKHDSYYDNQGLFLFKDTLHGELVLLWPILRGEIRILFASELIRMEWMWWNLW